MDSGKDGLKHKELTATGIVPDFHRIPLALIATANVKCNFIICNKLVKFACNMNTIKKGSMAIGLLMAIVSSATFGLLPLFSIPTMAKGISLNSLLVYRFAIAAIGMGVIARCSGVSLKIGWKDLRTLMLVSLGYAGCSIFLTMSYNYMPSGIATTVFFLFPILVAVMMVAFFKERLSWKVVLAAVLAMGGVYLLQGLGSTGKISGEGVVVITCSMIAYASYIVFLNHSRAKDLPNMVAMFYIFVCALVINLVKLLIMDGPHIDRIPDWGTFGTLLTLGLVPTMIADLILISAVKIVGSTTVALLSCMEPITAYLVGVLVFKEEFHPVQIAGILVIILSVFIVILTRGQIKKEKALQQNQPSNN